MKLIDDFLPKYDFAEVHEIQVQAPIEGDLPESS